MGYVVYSFEAKSIQRYVLGSSKLKDRIGASEQIESLCTKDGLLDEVLDQLNLKEDVKFARKGGGAFQAVFKEHIKNNLQKARELQALWTLTVQKKLPGLRFAQGIGQDDTKIFSAVKNALENQRASLQKIYPGLPFAGPLVARSARTGQPAIRSDKDNGEELLDETTDLKRRLHKGKLVTAKLGDLGTDGIKWPTAMPEKQDDFGKPYYFPIKDNNRYLGIFYADINNLGSISLGLFEQFENVENDDYLDDAKKFSENIEDSVVQAARKATGWIAKNVEKEGTVWPIRPLVLAGDDVVFLLRGDVALEFAKSFLKELEDASEANLKELRKKYSSIPPYLTACAGIAYVKASQPFFQAYRLAESLCKTAKKYSRKLTTQTKNTQQNLASVTPASIAFHRITTTMIEEYEKVLEEELTRGDLVVTMQPYLVGKTLPNHFPQLTDLQTLSKSLKGVGHGRMRELMSLLYENESQANRHFDRWRQVVDAKKPRTTNDVIDQLKKLTGDTDEKEPSFSDLMAKELKTRKTPLGDAIAKIMVERQEEE